jgi:hypothetical protein
MLRESRAPAEASREEVEGEVQEVARLAILLVGVAIGAYGMHWFYVLRQIFDLQDEYEAWLRVMIEQRHDDEIHLRDSA